MGYSIISAKDKIWVIPRPLEKGGTIILTEEKETRDMGEVFAVGKDIEDVKIGDFVVFSKFGPEDLIVSGVRYFVMKQEQIFAVIKQETQKLVQKKK